MIRYLIGGVGAVVALVGIALAADGIRWVSTSQMSMPGMPFSPPPQKSEFCAPLVWTRPPPGGDASCTNTNYKLVGNTATWDTVCTGRMPMTGTGRITFEGADKYSGQITATSEGVSMVITLSGRKADAPNSCKTAD